MTAPVRLGLEKSFPDSAIGLTTAEFVATGPTLDDFDTPLLVLNRNTLRHNVDLLARWAADAGVSLQPHAKTTMAPTLWQLQLDHGAVGLTVATVSQARVACRAGVTRVQIANELTSPGQVAAVARMIAEEHDVVVWVDSVAAVDLLSDSISRVSAGSSAGSSAESSTGPVALSVLVELGATGGRAGARSVEAGLLVAERVVAVPGLVLRGVAGYEGAVSHSRSVEAFAEVDRYLGRLRDLHRAVAHLTPMPGLISIGGSIYFDRVAAVFGPLAADGVEIVVRSGASILHDHGVYETLSPKSRTNQGTADPDEVLWPAARGYARVHSIPEPGLAILEGGKRDFAYDEGLPVVLRHQSTQGWQPVADTARVTATNDQHSFLRFEDDSFIRPLAVGDRLELGLSHPCTIMDKWRWIPVVDDWPAAGASAAAVEVVDVCRTWF